MARRNAAVPPPYNQSCPHCGAPAGYACIRPNGSSIDQPHAARGAGARHNGSSTARQALQDIGAGMAEAEEMARGGEDPASVFSHIRVMLELGMNSAIGKAMDDGARPGRVPKAVRARTISDLTQKMLRELSSDINFAQQAYEEDPENWQDTFSDLRMQIVPSVERAISNALKQGRMLGDDNIPDPNFRYTR